MVTSTSNTKWILWKSMGILSINDGFSATKLEDFSGIFRMFDDLRGRQLKHGLFQVCGNLVRACQNYMLVEAAMDGDLMISIWWPQNMILNDESVGLWIRKHWVIVRQHWGYKQQLMRMAAIFHQAGWLYNVFFHMWKSPANMFKMKTRQCRLGFSIPNIGWVEPEVTNIY